MKRAVFFLLLAGAVLSTCAPTPGELRRRIAETLFVPNPQPPLDPVRYGSFEPAPGVVAERISYGTEFGMRIPAILYRPAHPSGKAPALIVVNGHGGDKYAWYSPYTGILYARAGAFVLTYDPIGEGERNSERKSVTRQHDIPVPPEEMGRRMSGLMINDVRQAVSYLAQRPEVDPRRIAALGYSMGSFVLGITCAIETRLHACVLVGGGNLDGPGGYWDRSNHTMCQSIPYKSLLFLGDRGAVLYHLQALRGPTFVFNGTADGVVTSEPEGPQAFFADLRKRTIALHGSEHNVFEYGFEPNAGHRPYFVTRPVALWLQKQMQFPQWTPDVIASMPETHVGEWARREHVYIEPAYDTEVREAGIHALGSGIPGLTREQLTAVPLAQWEREKDRFVYEKWIEHAREAVQSPRRNGANF
ncbi:MAG TPA: prolyl oligopeptidase family serine peptidase [Bryobacteraceae bacterium]